MTLREIFNETIRRDDISIKQVSDILDTEIVPRKLVDDILTMIHIWKKNIDITIDNLSKFADDREQYVKDRSRFEGINEALDWCIDCIENELKYLENDE